MPGKSRLTSYLLKKSAMTNTMSGVTTTRNLILRKHGQKFRHRNLATLWSEYSKTDSNQINMDLFVAQPPINHSLTLKPLDYKNNGSHTYQFVIKRLLKMLQTRINAGFTKYFCLFKLNYNYCNTRNTRKSLQKTKVLLPDVLFRQATAPLSYFILFLQIGISHQ